MSFDAIREQQSPRNLTKLPVVVFSGRTTSGVAETRNMANNHNSDFSIPRETPQHRVHVVLGGQQSPKALLPKAGTSVPLSEPDDIHSQKEQSPTFSVANLISGSTINQNNSQNANKTNVHLGNSAVNKVASYRSNSNEIKEVNNSHRIKFNANTQPPIPLIQMPSNSHESIIPKLQQNNVSQPQQAVAYIPEGYSIVRVPSPFAPYSPSQPTQQNIYGIYPSYPTQNYFPVIYTSPPQAQTQQQQSITTQIQAQIQPQIHNSGMQTQGVQVKQQTNKVKQHNQQQSKQQSQAIGSNSQNTHATLPKSNPPLPQPIVTRMPVANQAAPVSNNDENDVKRPKPTIYTDKESGDYGICCVCGDGNIDHMLVQCDMCEYWLHGLCVNVARETKGEPFFCPFCLKRKIRCKCGESMKYSDPIIQCTKCQLWVHKACENLEFGINPENFVCSFCGGGVYDLRPIDFTEDDTSVPDSTIFIDNEKFNIINTIPDGLLKNMIEEDLNKGQINFREFVLKYFRTFAQLLFEHAHEFWRVFNETMCNILECERGTLLNALDTLATHLLYKPFKYVKPGRPTVKGFSHSESITEFLESEQMTRLEKQPSPIKIYEGEDKRIYSPVALDDGAFIAELPGFLMHTDEVRTDNGIPLSCLIVTDSDVIIDTEGTSFTFAPLIRRSFHFNCIVKLIKIKGEPRVGLFATRMKGPLSEEKSRRGPAIPANGEILLPFDGEIPYPIKKVEWKDKKQRGQKFSTQKGIKSTTFTTRSSALKKKSEKQASPPPSSHKKNHYEPAISLSLLSLFYDDYVPPMPFVLLDDDEAVDRYKNQLEMKSRTRSSRNRHRNLD